MTTCIQYLILTVPDEPIITVEEISAYSILVSFYSNDTNSVVERLDVKYWEDECSDSVNEAYNIYFFNKISAGSFELHNLRSGTTYSISATAINSAGYSDQSNVIYSRTEERVHLIQIVV